MMPKAEIAYTVEIDGLMVQAVSYDHSHEFRIIHRDGKTVLFESQEGYGQTGIALRDGLIKATDPLWIF